MADLGYDVSALRSQASKIATIRDDLQKAKSDLSNQLQSLRSDWNSDAGKAFFDNYDTDWINHIDQYCAMLSDLSNALADAANRYEPLTEEYNRLSLSV